MIDTSRLRSLIGWVLTAGIVALWFTAFRPPFLGGPATTIAVKGVSMNPTFDDGDLVVVHRKERYETGDVVAFRIPEGDLAAGARVVHRIVGGNARDGYVLQGDNNPYTDKWRPTPDDILGERWLHVPYAAKWLAHLRTPLVLASLAAVSGFIVVVTWSPKRRKEEGDDEDAAVVPTEDDLRIWTATAAAVALGVAAVVVPRPKP